MQDRRHYYHSCDLHHLLVRRSIMHGMHARQPMIRRRKKKLQFVGVLKAGYREASSDHCTQTPPAHGTHSPSLGLGPGTRLHARGLYAALGAKILRTYGSEGWRRRSRAVRPPWARTLRVHACTDPVPANLAPNPCVIGAMDPGRRRAAPSSSNGQRRWQSEWPWSLDTCFWVPRAYVRQNM